MKKSLSTIHARLKLMKWRGLLCWGQLVVVSTSMALNFNKNKYLGRMILLDHLAPLLMASMCRLFIRKRRMWMECSCGWTEVCGRCSLLFFWRQPHRIAIVIGCNYHAALTDTNKYLVLVLGPERQRTERSAREGHVEGWVGRRRWRLTARQWRKASVEIEECNWLIIDAATEKAWQCRPIRPFFRITWGTN